MTRLVTKFALLGAVAVLSVGAAIGALGVQWGTPDGDDHPYVGLAVFYDNEGTPLWRCTGTLISPTVFLTAGHCAESSPLIEGYEDGRPAQVWFDSEVTAALGYPLTGGVTGIGYSHPEWNGALTVPNTHDVGVVVLDEPVYMDEYGQLPAPGTLDSLATRRGTQSVTFGIVGYGLQSVKPVQQADRVRYAGEVQLVNLRSNLTDGYNLHLTAAPGKGTGGSGTCFGDSGGPVFYGDTIVAVNSFVLNLNCRGAGFGYRVDTQDSLDFISQFLD